MRGLEKNYMKRGHINIYIDGHCDSMKESAKGRFFEKKDTYVQEEGLGNGWVGGRLLFQNGGL